MKFLSGLVFGFALISSSAIADGVDLGAIDNFGPKSSGELAIKSEHAGSICDTFGDTSNCVQGAHVDSGGTGAKGAMPQGMLDAGSGVAFQDSTKDALPNDDAGSVCDTLSDEGCRQGPVDPNKNQ